MKAKLHADLSIVGATSYTGDGYLETQPVPTGIGGSMANGFARHPYGFIGRPNDPDVDATDPNNPQVTNGSHVLYFYEGNTLHAISLDDPRVNGKLPQVPKGGSVHYGAGPNGPSLAQHDGQGNYTVQIPDNANSLALTTKDGSLLVKLANGKVQIGDANAVPLARGDALFDVISIIAGATANAPETGLASIILKLAKYITPPGVPCQTTKAEGT